MMDNSITNQSGIQSIGHVDDEIDLKQVYGSLKRQKALIAKITIGSVLLTALYAFTSKAVWEGQFEIVLASTQSVSSQSSSLLQNNASVAKLIGADGSNDQLRTEVEILKSPSVLKPVFDFVKQYKQKNGDNIQNWRYSDWLENLKIDLTRGTSVLELTYRDTDKNLVLPVIEKISAAYQRYSGRDRERGLNQGIKYLDEQIEIYREKSAISRRASQEYGNAQNLTTLKGAGANDYESSINIEAIRIEASNQIRNIDEQLKQLNQLYDKGEFLMYLSKTVPGLASQDLPEQINEMDLRLALLRSKYKDRDNSIRNLTEQRRLLIEVFERQTYGYLNARRLAAQARLRSTERPKGVLIKYRELLRTAARDEATLTKLESERQVLGLEQARKEDPWELISNPTLLDKPVAPRKKRIVALGFFAGLIAGSGAALLVDRRTGLVYSEDELKSLLPCSLIKHLPAVGGSTWGNAADLIATGPLAKSPSNSAIALIPIGDVSKNQIQGFSTELRRALNGRDLLVSTDLRETSKCATQLLITSPGVATRKQLKEFRQKLALQGSPLAGWIFIEPSSI